MPGRRAGKMLHIFTGGENDPKQTPFQRPDFPRWKDRSLERPVGQTTVKRSSDPPPQAPSTGSETKMLALSFETSPRDDPLPS